MACCNVNGHAETWRQISVLYRHDERHSIDNYSRKSCGRPSKTTFNAHYRQFGQDCFQKISDRILSLLLLLQSHVYYVQLAWKPLNPSHRTVLSDHSEQISRGIPLAYESLTQTGMAVVNGP
jgi:hypothetical protein